MSEPELFAVLRVVVERLDRLALPYLVGGSLASSLFGEPRLTRDIDVVVALTSERIEALARALEVDFYVDRAAMREAVDERRAFNAVHLETGIKIDFFVLGRSAFDAQEFERRRAWTLALDPPLVLQVKRVEDSVLRKLEWFRAGGEVAGQQWRDVVALLALNEVDERYLDRWAAELGVSDLLARARHEALG